MARGCLTREKVDIHSCRYRQRGCRALTPLAGTGGSVWTNWANSNQVQSFSHAALNCIFLDKLG
jgi:hypothetical protein